MLSLKESSEVATSATSPVAESLELLAMQVAIATIAREPGISLTGNQSFKMKLPHRDFSGWSEISFAGSRLIETLGSNLHDCTKMPLTTPAQLYLTIIPLALVG